MKTGFIGAGKVGVSLGKYFSEHGTVVSGYYSKTIESAAQAARSTGSSCFTRREELLKASDIIFITTPDREISGAWDRIANHDITGKIICHCSGSLSSEVFSNIECTGAAGCSAHPIYAFSDKLSSYKNFDKAMLTVEGDPSAVSAVRALFERLGHRVFEINSSKKALYHASTVFASNLVIGLLASSADLLKKCGLSGEEAVAAIEPLARGNMDQAFAKGFMEALTGPVERGDVETVAAHIAALEGCGCEDELTIYRSLTKKLIETAALKHPGRDNERMEKLI